MGADRYSRCPGCVKRAEATLAALRAEVEVAYGKVSFEEFDDLRMDVEHWYDRLHDMSQFKTYREDWSISGIEDGVLVFTYSGQCSCCKLKFSCDYTWDIPL